jgi:tryptophanyl-tRNA synthetase
MEERYRAGGFGYGQAKKALADRLEAHFAPMRRRREELAREPDRVEAVLRRGAERARAEARATLARARRAAGLD